MSVAHGNDARKRTGASRPQGEVNARPRGRGTSAVQAPIKAPELNQNAAVQCRISRILSEATSLDLAAPQVLQILCEAFGWDIASLWAVNAGGDSLECVEVWQAAPLPLVEFKAVTRDLVLVPGEGLPGRVWFTGASAWSPEFASERNSPRGKFATTAGLKAGAAFPVWARGDVVGVLEYFSREPIEPDPGVVQMLESVGRQLGQFIGWLRAETRVEQLRKEFQRRDRMPVRAERGNEVQLICNAVSQDLRAPLRAVQGFATALLEDYGGSLERGARDYVERITNASGRMGLLIGDLMEYGQLTARKGRFCRVDLEPRARAVIEKLLPAAQSRQGEVKVKEPLGSVWGDPMWIDGVLSHLIKNGLACVEEATRPEIEIASVTKAGRVRVIVRDNGGWITPGHQERIFEPFHRMYSQDTLENTGISLAIVKRSIEEMNGRVGVESSETGSCFWFELPVVPREELNGSSGCAEA